MNKMKFFIILLLPVSVWSQISSLTPNQRKAGEEALAIREERLQKLSQEIFQFLLNAPENGRISGMKMYEIVKRVRQFEKEKKEADRWLEIYNLKTQTTLDHRIVKMVEIYAKPLFRHHDKNGAVRKIVADITGKDVIIENYFDSKIFILLLIFLTVFLWTLILGITIESKILFYYGLIGVWVFVCLLIAGALGL